MSVSLKVLDPGSEAKNKSENFVSKVVKLDEMQGYMSSQKVVFVWSCVCEGTRLPSGQRAREHAALPARLAGSLGSLLSSHEGF